LNIIQIVSDTLRRDFLGCYGNERIHTKHLDNFAKESLVFDKAYVASWPTIPHRRDLFTGRYAFTYSAWSFQGGEPNLPRDEIILSQTLRQDGFTTMIIGDTYHLFRDCHGFDRGFDGWLWIRGQEGDRYMTHPTKDSKERQDVLGTQYLRNVSMRRFEKDYFVAQTMDAAVKWLELNYDQHEKFFLHIDTFDPHEPWDPPKWYTDMYDPGWKGGDVPGIAYAPHRQTIASELSEDELNHLKALYAGEVTLVDRWVGKLLQKIEDLGLFEDTVVIFTTDHGTFLGEHNRIGKWDLYEEVAHIPLMIRTPDSMGSICGRCEALVQVPDIMPTILELAGTQIPDTVEGKSLLPLIRGERTWKREIAVSGLRTVTSKEWSLMVARKPTPDKPGPELQPELYHLSTDPKQTRNLYADRRDVADKLLSKMIEFLKAIGAREETLNRLG